MSSNHLTFSPTAICALPLARRLYKTFVAGLAVFIATLAIVRVPFRGYLSEVQVSGPPLAGLELNEAAKWVKQVDSQVAVVAVPAGTRTSLNQIRITFLGKLPDQATNHLNDLAARLLCQYLPDQLSSYRRTALADLRAASLSCREAEDAARQKLDELRQQQLARMLRLAAEPLNAAVERPRAVSEAGPPKTSVQEPARQRIESLKLELSRLLASFTDNHPEVVTVRSQIAALERQLNESRLEGAAGAELELSTRQPTNDAKSGEISNPLARNFVAVEAEAAPDLMGASGSSNESDGIDELNAAQAELTKASRRRQEAEQNLSERMQELSNGPTASDWAASRARVVMRLGGTPRSATLGLAAILAAICGVGMFRAAGEDSTKTIRTTGELATALEIPVIGNLAKKSARADSAWAIWRPLAVRWITHVGEGAIGIAVLACLVSISVEPSLGEQVLADPFGALSEVIGRLSVG